MAGHSARLSQMGRVAKFGIVGVLNTSIDLGLFTVLHFWLGMAPLSANTISYGSGILNSFCLNKFWTFSDRRASRRVPFQFPLFLGLNLAALGLSNLTLWLLDPWLGTFAAKVASIGVTFMWNYISSTVLVFRK